MSPKQRDALRKLFNLPPNKSFLLPWNKNFLTEIYRNIQIVLQECSSWASRNGAVQVFFPDKQPETFLLENL